MVDHSGLPNSALNANRERDVLSFHAAFRNLPAIENLGPSPDTHSIPSHHVPEQATDASLAAFCQLAAMRLNAARSLISLIDDEHQYILAEATPRTSLKQDSRLNKDSGLAFGSVRLPRRYVHFEYPGGDLTMAGGGYVRKCSIHRRSKRKASLSSTISPKPRSI